MDAAARHMVQRFFFRRFEAAAPEVAEVAEEKPASATAADAATPSEPASPATMANDDVASAEDASAALFDSLE